MLKKINDIKVHKIQLDAKKLTPDKIQGYDMFSEIYANIFICARKKTGKTTIMCNIIKKCINKDTTLIFFVGTINKDATYKKMLEYLDNKGIVYFAHDSIYEDGKDLLSEYIEEINGMNFDEKEEDSESEDDNVCDENCKKKYYDDNHVCILKNDNEIKIKIRKPKKEAPKYMIIFDDISSEIRDNKTLINLLKKNRHYRSKIIVSSQYIHDMPPSSLEQCDYFIILGGHRIEKLKKIYEASDPVIELKTFIDLYNDSTREKFNFFYIDKVNNTYRKNFDKEYCTELDYLTSSRIFS